MQVNTISEQEFEFEISLGSFSEKEVYGKNEIFVYKTRVTQTTLLATNNFWYSHDAIREIIIEFSERKTTMFNSDDNKVYKITFDCEKTVNDTRIG